MVIDNLVLVLNGNWTAIRIRTVKDALRLVFAERAVILNNDPQTGVCETYTWEKWLEVPIKDKDIVIQAVNSQVKCPEIVILTKYHKVPTMTRITKKKIYMRDQGICQYTGKKLKPDELNIDHVIPRSLGGKFSWDNCVCCSKDVNTKKGNRTPDQAGLKLLKRPSKPNAPILIDKRKNYPESWKPFMKTVEQYAKLAESESA
jgi:hypothetical protein